MKKLKLDINSIIKKLEIASKEAVSSDILGGYKSFFRGRGFEFDSYRTYSPSEDAHKIDWKASLRAGEVLVKEYVEERNLEIFFLIDTSASMVYGSGRKLKSEYAAEVVASLAYVTLHAEDSIGFALFNRRIVSRSKIAKGIHQFYNLSKNLVNPYYYGDKYDFVAALKFLIGYLKRGTVVIIVSDFIGLKAGWERYLTIASSKLDIVSIMIRDPADSILPSDKHHVLFSDPYSNKQVIVVPDRIKYAYNSYNKIRDEKIKETFIKARCDFIKLETDKPFTSKLIKFFNRRKSRLS